MVADLRGSVALYVPPIYDAPLRGTRPNLPITVEQVSPEPVEALVVTARGPSTIGGGPWESDREIGAVSLYYLGSRQTVMWNPPVLPTQPSYSAMIRAGNAEAFCWIIGAPEGTEQELSGKLPGYDPWAERRWMQLTFAVRPPGERAITGKSMRQVVEAAFGIIGQGQPVKYRLWVQGDRQGGIVTRWHYVLHVEYLGDPSPDTLCRGISQALGLVGIEPDVVRVGMFGKAG